MQQWKVPLKETEERKILKVDTLMEGDRLTFVSCP